MVCWGNDLLCNQRSEKQRTVLCNNNHILQRDDFVMGTELNKDSCLKYWGIVKFYKRIKWITKANAIFPNPFIACSSCKRKFFVCPFADVETTEIIHLQTD
jgi:hypothetical protein